MSVIYKPLTWWPMPDAIDKLFRTLSPPEFRLYFALCSHGRGQRSTLEFGNAELMLIAKLNRSNLSKTRESLQDTHKLIRVTPLDTRGERYRYEILATTKEPDVVAVEKVEERAKAKATAWRKKEAEAEDDVVPLPTATRRRIRPK